MSDSLIAQVKRLAEAQKGGEQASCYSHSRTIVSCIADDTDFVALLAHLERMQAVVDAARSERIGIDHTKTCRIHRAEDCTCGGWDAFARLNAALENLENNDGK